MSADRHFIPLHRPDLGEPECQAAARAILSGWVSQGPEVEAFEREFAALVNADHAVAVSNGTVALELGLRALRIGVGDEVITVSHSFVATANAIRAVGARPVFIGKLVPLGTMLLGCAVERPLHPFHQLGRYHAWEMDEPLSLEL